MYAWEWWFTHLDATYTSTHLCGHPPHHIRTGESTPASHHPYKYSSISSYLHHQIYLLSFDLLKCKSQQSSHLLSFSWQSFVIRLPIQHAKENSTSSILQLSMVSVSTFIHLPPNEYLSSFRIAPDRVRRGCDCRTTTGRCVDTGKYQCYFQSSGASIVQCVGGNRWVTIGKCPSSCRSWGNDQPYCS